MRKPSGLLISIALLLIVEAGFAQNFIGMHKDEIKQTMKETQKSLKLNTSTVNKHYNYLKYEDPINEITVFYFLSDQDECIQIRKIYDYSNINDVVAQLNDDYKEDGFNKWYYKDKGKKYDVILKEDDWFFTVTVKKEEKKD